MSSVHGDTKTQDKMESIHLCEYAPTRSQRTKNMDLKVLVTGFVGFDAMEDAVDDDTRLWHLSTDPPLPKRDLKHLYKTVSSCSHCQDALVDLCQPQATRVTTTERFTKASEALESFTEMICEGNKPTKRDRYLEMSEDWDELTKNLEDQFQTKFARSGCERTIERTKPFMVFQNIDYEEATIVYSYRSLQ